MRPLLAVSSAIDLLNEKIGYVCNLLVLLACLVSAGNAMIRYAFGYSSNGWLEAQLAEAKTEPNSGLGKAISYLLNHWTKLTLFLRQADAPIDNNIVERALKKAILNRKNALFYKTLNGAGVGDLFMSLIHTSELNGANPFHYLTELLRHAEELKQKPSWWMPWNYRDTLARLATPAAA